jgi:hypothetical protein
MFARSAHGDDAAIRKTGRRREELVQLSFRLFGRGFAR